MIYLDNAATSYPKPNEVYDKVYDVMVNCGASAGRGSYTKSIESSRLIYKTRNLIAQLYNIKDCERIAFTKNATEAINLALKGLLKKGDHVLITSLEHNSVYRTLNRLKDLKIIDYDIIYADKDGLIRADDFKEKIRFNTKLFVCNYVSNIIGTICPIKEISKIAKQNDILFMVDCAQAVGHMPIDVQDLNIDILCFTGHKGLFGPQGTGGIYISKNVDLIPLIEGGTGGDSSLELNPEDYPDRLEAGTLNVPCIAGLGEGINFVCSNGYSEIMEHERNLLCKTYEKISNISGIELYGTVKLEKRLSIILLNLINIPCDEVGYKLDKYFGIMVRTGLHCSPLAHKTIGTIDKGAVRISYSYFNKYEEIEKLVTALLEIQRGEV